MKNLMKLGLLIPCMAFVTSCSKTQATAQISQAVYEVQKKDDASATHYLEMDYTIGITSGKSKKVKASNFHAVVNGEKKDSTCLFDKVTTEAHDRKTYYYYNEIVNEVELPTHETTSTAKIIRVGFKLDSGVKADSEFYFNDTKLTTETKIITL